MNQSDNEKGAMPQIPIGQHQHPNPQFVQPKKKGGCLRIGLIIFAVLIAIGIIGAIFSDDKSTDKSENNITKDILTTDSLKEPEAINQLPKSNWSYSESIDEMTDKTTFLASVTSENEVNFDFPYNGGSVLTLTIRQSPQYGKDIYIKISKGQFNCGVYGETIKVRFDDDKPITFNCVEPSDHSSDLLFIQNHYCPLKMDGVKN